MKQLNDDRLDDIASNLVDYIQDNFHINMEDDSIFVPFWNFVHDQLCDYSNGDRNWN